MQTLHPASENAHGSFSYARSSMGTYVSDALAPLNFGESSCLYTGYVWHVKSPLWFDPKSLPATLNQDVNMSAP